MDTETCTYKQCVVPYTEFRQWWDHLSTTITRTESHPQGLRGTARGAREVRRQRDVLILLGSRVGVMQVGAKGPVFTPQWPGTTIDFAIASDSNLALKVAATWGKYHPRAFIKKLPTHP